MLYLIQELSVPVRYIQNFLQFHKCLGRGNILINFHRKVFDLLKKIKKKVFDLLKMLPSQLHLNAFNSGFQQLLEYY